MEHNPYEINKELKSKSKENVSLITFQSENTQLEQSTSVLQASASEKDIKTVQETNSNTDFSFSSKTISDINSDNCDTIDPSKVSSSLTRKTDTDSKNDEEYQFEEFTDFLAQKHDENLNTQPKNSKTTELFSYLEEPLKNTQILKKYDFEGKPIDINCNIKISANNRIDAESRNVPNNQEFHESESVISKNYPNYAEKNKEKLNNVLIESVKNCLDSFTNVEKSPEKVNFIVNYVKNEIKKVFQNHKIIVNIIISENIGYCFKMNVECLLNEENDLYAHFAYQSDTIDLIASAYAILC